MQEICAKGTKKESNTLDAADLVRDVIAEEEGWSQGVDATLACSLSAGVSNPNVFRGR